MRVYSVDTPHSESREILGFKAELRAVCPPELLGTEVPRYLEASMKFTDDRECFTPGRFAPDNAPNIQLCKVLLAGPKPTRHVLITRANRPSIAQAFENNKERGPFIPMSNGRGALVLLR
jgi:hypothetical protein